MDASTPPTTFASPGAHLSSSPATVPPTELLLRSRRLPQARDASVSPFPGPSGRPGRHRHPDQRHAAGALATTGPRAVARCGADRRTIARWQFFLRDTFPRRRSGRSPVPVWCRWPRSSPCPTSFSWTSSSAAIAAAGVGRSCRGFSHRSRSPEPYESRSHDDRRKDARCSQQYVTES